MAHEDGYHHGNLRVALLDSTATLLRERGLAFVSLREVARHSKVSHSAPAHHFKNKAGLLTAFAVQGYERLHASVDERVSKIDSSDPRAMLDTLGRTYVAFALENPEQFAIMFRSEAIDPNDPKLRESSDRAYASLSSVVKACVAQGYARSQDPNTLTAAAWSIAHGLAGLLISGRLSERLGATDGAAVTARVIHLFVSSVLGDFEAK